MQSRNDLDLQTETSQWKLLVHLAYRNCELISRSHLDGRQHGGLGPPKGISSHDPHPELGWAAVFRR